MGVDALVARMTQDAQARIAAVRADADAEIAALERARATAASLDQSRDLATTRAARRAALAAERARARRRAAGRVLAAQHAFLGRVFARAAALAATADDPRWVEALSRDVAALGAHLGGQAAVLRCRPELTAALQRCAAGLPDVEVEADASLPAGFVATTRDGRCTIDCTVPARLAALRPALQATLLARVPR